MDMQSVSRLRIPEGDVRTIHDKDSRLLWGRLSYDVKYSGNIDQNTYTGKNLLPPTQDFQETIDSVNIDYSAGVFTIDGTSATSGAHTATWHTPISSYTIQSGDYWHYNNDFTSPQMLIQVRFTDNTTLAQAITVVNRIIDMSNYVGKTIKDMRLYFQGGHTFSGTMSPMIVNGVSAATAYEPYVGGIPAPNPNYPQPINASTGIQTVTITGGTVSDNFTINLGSLVLIKVGTYHDYIYKQGSNWYVHKEIGKYTFDGTENWGTIPDGTNSWKIENVLSFPFDTNKIQVISNIFTGIKHADRNTAGPNVIYVAANNEVDIRNTTLTTVSEVQTATNGNYLYYVMDSATDTQVTDTTLIDQLDAVNQWLTRYGYLSTIDGDVPIIIDKTNL